MTHSCSQGISVVPIRGETIGDNLRRTARRFPGPPSRPGAEP